MGFFEGVSKSSPVMDDPPMMDQEVTDRVIAPELPRLPKPRSETLIAEGMTVTGSIRGEGTVHIEGAVEGEINVSGSVLLMSTGQVKGPIEAGVVQIAGHVEGNIKARSHLCLQRSGRIDGDVITGSFVIEDGGKLNGRAAMTQADDPGRTDGGPDRPRTAAKQKVTL